MCLAESDEMEQFLHQAYMLDKRTYSVKLIELKGGKVHQPSLCNIQAKIIGSDCTFHAYTWVGENAEIGDRVKVQAFAFIPDGVKIGNDVFIGPHVCFTNDKHPPASSKQKWIDTYVHNGVSIGAGAIILPGVILAVGARIGAGAIVTRNVGPHMTVVGNPARPLTS